MPASIVGVAAESPEHRGGGGDGCHVLRTRHLLVNAVVVDLPPDKHGVSVARRNRTAYPCSSRVIGSVGGDQMENPVVVNQRLTQRPLQVLPSTDADAQGGGRVARARRRSRVMPQNTDRVERATDRAGLPVSLRDNRNSGLSQHIRQPGDGHQNTAFRSARHSGPPVPAPARAGATGHPTAITTSGTRPSTTRRVGSQVCAGGVVGVVAAFSIMAGLPLTQRG
jgi:hypothetical protein